MSLISASKIPHGAQPSSRARNLRNYNETPLDRMDYLPLRVSAFRLGLSFLSAVADRFGLWGAFGQPNVSWGNFARFVDYTAKLNWFLPMTVIPTLAVIATVAEAALGLLLIGWKLRLTFFLSGLLLMAFTLTMTLALGIKSPLNLSVFTAAAGALMLSVCQEFPFSVDAFLLKSTNTVNP
jgi:hypothetical protein